MPINNLSDFRTILHDVMMLEHSTVPPYLCALYSIPHGSNEEASGVIQTVAMEEMLHMVLVANLTNAVGGDFVLNKKAFVPSYPTPLPRIDPPFEVGLQKFSEKAISLFMKIERPEPRKPRKTPPGKYATIGDFYHDVRKSLQTLVDDLGEKNVFSGDESLQIRPEHYYGGAGEIIIVRNLEDAKRAIKEIVDQGEGLPGQIGAEGVRSGKSEFLHRRFSGAVEPAHFFRFDEIHTGRYYQKGDTVGTGPRGPEFPVDWDDAFNMQPSPRAKNYAKHPAIRAKLDDFNRCYMRLLDALRFAFDGQPEKLTGAVGDMFELKHRAVELMRIPNPLDDGATMVGPGFEFTTERRDSRS